jgi:hypothetical protein
MKGKEIKTKKARGTPNPFYFETQGSAVGRQQSQQERRIVLLVRLSLKNAFERLLVPSIQIRTSLSVLSPHCER